MPDPTYYDQHYYQARAKADRYRASARACRNVDPSMSSDFERRAKSWDACQRAALESHLEEHNRTAKRGS